MEPKKSVNFVRYRREFVITVIVITEFVGSHFAHDPFDLRAACRLRKAVLSVLKRFKTF